LDKSASFHVGATWRNSTSSLEYYLILVVDTSRFKRSRFSWFRCPYCNVATYSATSQTILSKKRPKVAVEYRCEHCSRISTLRNAGLMHVGLPCALAACTLAIAYSPPFQAIPWYSFSGISLLVAIMVGEIMISLAIARVAKRFDRT
jgi:hypothetical protein